MSLSLSLSLSVETAAAAAADSTSGGVDDEIQSKLVSLRASLRPYILRRLKRDVLTLPPTAELVVPVDLAPVQRAIYRAVLQRNYAVLRAGGNKSSLQSIVTDMQKACSHPLLDQTRDVAWAAAENPSAAITNAGKLDLLMRLLRALRRSGHRVLVFSQMTRMLDIIEAVCAASEDPELPMERLDGSTSLTQRQIAIDRFNDPLQDSFGFLISTKAGGLGLNLTAADTVILYDSAWNPHVDLQALARSHRFGQTVCCSSVPCL